MTQFKRILKFELSSYLHNKVFMGTTIVLSLVIAIVVSFPRFQGLFTGRFDSQTSELEEEIIVIKPDDQLDQKLFSELYVQSIPTAKIQFSNESLEQIQDKVENGEIPAALVANGDGYTYIVPSLSMNDSTPYVAAGVLTQVSKIQTMKQFGLSMDDIDQVMNQSIQVDVENLGLDQGNTFFYTYVMILALYMAVVIYGQMVATNVASEKNNRAMELLVTSAKPSNMLFGKVMSSCIAGLIQLVAVFGTALLFYQLNKSYWQDNYVINSLFSMPVELMLYMILFFVLGFVLYASLFGAVGSLATKTEDINTLSLPIIFCFVGAYMLVVIPISTGNLDAAMMKFASFFPLTSPFAMFARIAMSTVPYFEIVISAVILIVSVFGVGVLSAKMYRVGVLMYGTKPTFSTLVKAMRNS